MAIELEFNEKIRCRGFLNILYKIFIYLIVTVFVSVSLISVVSAESSVINTPYTYVDGNSCNILTYPSAYHTSYMGLSMGEVAYRKYEDPLVYIWNSTTKETKTFDTKVIGEKRKANDWISYKMGIESVDISDGIVYFSLQTSTTTPNGTCAFTEGMFSLDSDNNYEKISDGENDIVNLRAFDDLVLMDELSDMDCLRVYSRDTGNIITLDNRGLALNNIIGFGDNNAALSLCILSSHQNVRKPEDGITVFRLPKNITGNSFESVTIPSSTGYSYTEGEMAVSQDCFSGDKLIWSKEVSPDYDNSGENGWAELCVTDLNTLRETVIDTINEPVGEMNVVREKDNIEKFGFYSYAVDGDYVVYKKSGHIYLYHIPDGMKKEIHITGNDEFEVGDIIEFDNGQLLLRAYPKDYPGYEPNKYEIWFVDLNPFINPNADNSTETGNNREGNSNLPGTESPLSPFVSLAALLITSVVFWGARRRK
ncbi:hypothetical protein J2128_002168 [Methanomicrobium sp. W14]|uniref:peptidoglycan amidohydrolase family protein n=1 Tax=Methanomicrobium sp. W14 TaxID=2817839 RepID=UPI001AE7C966|nr:peptidoglycan amidohydrolase family protein [Methanomicrobium sp. W14]MBP2134202.1 hypothetical protein [Methanomicrobium sp. W14]